jgi:hypothetical protein
MKLISLTTIEGQKIEINPELISEIVEEQGFPAFLGLFGGEKTKYIIHMNDNDSYSIDRREHEKLQKEMKR